MTPTLAYLMVLSVLAVFLILGVVIILIPSRYTMTGRKLTLREWFKRF